MGKKGLLLVIGLFCSFSINADDIYPDDDEVVVNTSKTVTVDSQDDTNELRTAYGLGFFSYDGFENYGLSGGLYKFNGVGMTYNIRSNYKFKDNQNTSNADWLLNFSMGIYKNEDVMFMITPEIGPSLGSRYVYEDGKVKDKMFIDGFVGIKATVIYKKLVLSAGYHIWAPKWKFGKDEKADGFYAQLGFDF